jgi:hypothetical protein
MSENAPETKETKETLPDHPDLKVVEVEEEAPAIKKLLGLKAELPIRAFLVKNLKSHFTNPDDITLFLADDARIVAEYTTESGKTYQADFLFYESREPRVGGIMVKESHNLNLWVMQATTGWVEQMHHEIMEFFENQKATDA